MRMGVDHENQEQELKRLSHVMLIDFWPRNPKFWALTSENPAWTSIAQLYRIKVHMYLHFDSP